MSIGRPEDRIDDAVAAQDDKVVHAAVRSAGVRVEHVSPLTDTSFGGGSTECVDDLRFGHAGRNGLVLLLRQAGRGSAEQGENEKTAHWSSSRSGGDVLEERFKKGESIGPA